MYFFLLLLLFLDIRCNLNSLYKLQQLLLINHILKVCIY
uniref:Uncharacterized protein n=1 Tax=virus sp. ctmTa7 TaxID=2828255 RepID=A0A8S5RCA2_9VIRU|nr:MAG TPA: hypothetical protein [virus sp. ctmTa7]